MARQPRFVLPGFPQHVIQRGQDRQRILIEEADYWFIWERLGAAAERFGCAIHAYALMPDHFHLLLTPLRENSVGKLMQNLGRYYVQYFNQKYERTGTLWDARYRATLLDPKEWLLPVARYIEGNPARAGLVASPADYDWSSQGANARGTDDRLVTPHEEYLRLGRSARSRQARYAELAAQPLEETAIARIREATNKSWVLGGPGFCHGIDKLLNRPALPRPRGGDRRSLAFRQSRILDTAVGASA